MGITGFLRTFYGKLNTMREMISYLWKSKNWWLIPFVILLFAFGILFMVGQSTALGPLIYALF